MIALSVLALVGCGPSCAERGGKVELSHWTTMFNGRTTVVMPVYRCKGALQ
jgi:hypothetical protein